MTTETEKQEAVAIVTKVDPIARAMEKLNRKSVDVTVPVNLSMVEMLKSTIESLRESKSENKESSIKEAEQQIAALEKDSIVGTLVPLKSADMLVVHGFVTEVGLKVKEHGIDLDVQLFLLSKAERCGIAYLALRERDNHGVRYFKSQEDVAMIDDQTTRHLARIYSESFVLTEEERKNLYGAPRS